jgi:hypothetical protein
MSGTIPNIELRFYLLHDPSDNGGFSYYAFTEILDVMSIVPNLFDVEHEWRFEHKNLTGDPDGYAETEIYCDDVLLKNEKINISSTSSTQKAIGFNQGTGPDNIYSLRLGCIGSRVSYFIINEKLQTPPPPPPNIPDIQIDWPSLSIRDKTGAFIDEITILNNTSNSASSSSQYQLLDNKVMRFNQNNHIRMREGIPRLLKDYQGDMTMVYHGASKATNGISFLLNMMNWFGQITAWVIKINDRGYETVLGRLSGHQLQPIANVPVNLPFKNLHTISFAYTERYTATDSKVEVYWDGVKLSEAISPYSPIRWNTGDNIYIGRFGNQFINGISYVNNLKVYKKAFTSQEMLDEHTSIPTGLTQFEADTA